MRMTKNKERDEPLYQALCMALKNTLWLGSTTLIDLAYKNLSLESKSPKEGNLQLQTKSKSTQRKKIN